MSNIATPHALAKPSRPIMPMSSLPAQPHSVMATSSTNDHQVTEIKDIITSFKHLLSEHPDSSAGDGIKREIFVLERWLSSFRRGLISAAKLAANGPAWLNLHRGELAHASEEALQPEPGRNSPNTRDPMLLTRDTQDKTYVGVTHNSSQREANHASNLDLN